MTEIMIKVNEADIAKLVVEQIAENLSQQYSAEGHDAKWGIRKGAEQAVKDYVYFHVLMPHDKEMEQGVGR